MIDAIVAGMCYATFSASPAVTEAYGGHIVAALGVVSAETGIQFRQVDGDADIEYATTAMPGPMEGRAWDTGLIELDSELPVWPMYTGQRQPHYERFRLRLVLHETIHALGYMKHAGYGNVMHEVVGDGPVRLGPADVSFLDSLECK